MAIDASLRQRVVSYLRSLSDEDLARLFYEAMAEKNTYRQHDDGSFWNDVYVVGVTSHMSGAPAETYLLATAHDTNELILDEIKNDGAIQQGRCENCSSVVTSTSKIAKCPVCAVRVECT